MGKGFKVAGLIIGILGIIMAFISIVLWPLAFVALPMSIAGLVLSIIGNKKEKTGLGTAAFVLCLLAVIFTGIMFFTCGICVAIAAATL